MKNTDSKEHSLENRDKMKRSSSVMMKNKKKNQRRLGGGGLSLEVFANAKTKDTNYNPSLIKKQRQFYKNAKYVNKYKKSLKHINEPQNPPYMPTTISEERNDEATTSGNKEKRNKKKSKQSMEEIYAKKKEEQEKARMEKEASIKARKEAIEKTKAQRKESREKMHKRTRSGQPVMKYRIEHILQSIQGSNS